MFKMVYMRQLLQNLIYVIPAMLIAITLHEYAHGFVSYKLGDSTPKQDGRLTLNPFAHMDLWGTICLILFRMGWAKPVRINVGCYKNRKKGIIMVALAGPITNYLVAFISMLLYGLCYLKGFGIAVWFYYCAVVNIGLGTFNLIPIPPLDGSNVLMELVPKVKNFYGRIRKYAPIVMFVCVATGILRYPLDLANEWVMEGMWKSVKAILKLFIIPQSTGTYI